MTVVLVDPRRPSLVPVDAVAHLRGDVQYTEEMPVKVPWSLPSARPAYDGEDAPVLLSSDPEHPAVKARLAAGDTLIAAPDPQAGERLVDAVALMDKLRTSGPWESEQTHDSLRRYLLEETYELFDAVRNGDADELRDELGDVLLQVLFHARIAEDAPHHSFTIDDVADALVRKLGNRVPAVLAGESISLDDQLAQWEERKAAEKAGKRRLSSMDDVPTGQPALALAQKVIARATAAGLPADLIPAALTTVTLSSDVDAESALRADVLEFMDRVRSAEKSIATERRGDDVPEELDDAVLGVVAEEEWRGYWPTSGEDIVLPDGAEVAVEAEAPVEAEVPVVVEEPPAEVSDTVDEPDEVDQPDEADETGASDEELPDEEPSDFEPSDDEPSDEEVVAELFTEAGSRDDDLLDAADEADDAEQGEILSPEEAIAQAHGTDEATSAEKAQ